MRQPRDTLGNTERVIVCIHNLRVSTIFRRRGGFRQPYPACQGLSNMLTLLNTS